MVHQSIGMERWAESKAKLGDASVVPPVLISPMVIKHFYEPLLKCFWNSISAFYHV